MSVDFTADAVGSNLPAQVEALIQAKNDYAVEISRLQAEFSDLQEELSKGKREKELLVLESNALISKICSVEEEVCRKKMQVEKVEKDLSRAIEENVNVKWELWQKERQYRETQRKYSEDIRKMEAYKATVAESEKEIPVMKEIEDIRQEIEELRAQKTEMEKRYRETLDQICGRGETKEEIEMEMAELESEVGKERTLLQDAQCRFEERRQERQRMETANIILQKRNAALLTRLRRQVDEQREKHEQLTSHVQMTQDKIDSAKAKLDKLSEGHS